MNEHFTGILKLKKFEGKEKKKDLTLKVGKEL